MLWSRFILILMLALVSARPSPELSLEEIEKELEQLTAKENDASDTIQTKSDQATSTKEDAAKEKDSEVPKELIDKTREVNKAKLETLEKTVTETEQKKDATTETKADTDKKATDTSADAAFESPKKSAKSDFKDTPAYRRLMESVKSVNAHHPLLRRPDFPEAPSRRTYDYYKKYDNLPSFPRPYHPQFPARRTYDAEYDYPSFPGIDHPPLLQARSFSDVTYHKNYDYPPSRDFDQHRGGFVRDAEEMEILRKLASDHGASDENRGGFLPNSDPIEVLRGLRSGMTRTERVALSRGSWVPGSAPVKVPGKMPPPPLRDTAVRSNDNVHRQLNDKEAEDLIHGKDGLTDAEKRKRYLIDQLAEKIKTKVIEAQKRGLKVPDKIMDFLWDYESRRGMNTKPDKGLFSH